MSTSSGVMASNFQTKGAINMTSKTYYCVYFTADTDETGIDVVAFSKEDAFYKARCITNAVWVYVKSVTYSNGNSVRFTNTSYYRPY